MSSILYYITGHGFGHAVRSSQVIQSVTELRPDLKVHARTTAPEWLFPPSVIRSHQTLDAGIVQSDCLEMDLDETLRVCQGLSDQARAGRLIETEIDFIRSRKVELVVGDVPPLCFDIAARAGVPSVAITNFTWNAIYSAYVDERPAFIPLIKEMERCYRQATLGLALPYPCGLDVFPSRQPIPWISRVSSLTKDKARAKLGLPKSGTIVLLSFGGLGLRRLPLERIRKLKEFFFLSTGEREQRFDNVVVLPDLQHHYQDLVRAGDIIVSKPGYGIVADVLAHQVPLLYTDRGNFPEYPFLVDALSDLATAGFIPQDELLAGNLGPYINTLLNKEPNWPDIELNGASAAAEKILDLLAND